MNFLIFFISFFVKNKYYIINKCSEYDYIDNIDDYIEEPVQNIQNNNSIIIQPKNKLYIINAGYDYTKIYTNNKKELHDINLNLIKKSILQFLMSDNSNVEKLNYIDQLNFYTNFTNINKFNILGGQLLDDWEIDF
jgi:hypothetical protein